MLELLFIVKANYSLLRSNPYLIIFLAWAREKNSKIDGLADFVLRSDAHL
jgi:hypothetical protein